MSTGPINSNQNQPSRKRTHGAGTVERLPSGRWRFRLTVADGTRRSSASFDSREECEAVRAAAVALLATGAMAPIGAVTLGGYGERFLAARTVRSVAAERGLWQNHVAGTALAAMPIAEIRRRHLRDFLAELVRKPKRVPRRGGRSGEHRPAQEPLSIQSCRLVLALLRRVLSEAVTDELIATNPGLGQRLGIAPAARGEPAWTFLLAEEIRQLLGCEQIPEAVRLIYQVAIFTGLRQGELWGLRWQDLSLEDTQPLCVVRRSYDGPTKAGKVRRFPLLPAALAALRRVRALSGDVRPQALVFPSPRGGPYCKGYDAGWARRHRKLAGIRSAVVFHAFRHTCASHLVMGTWGRPWSLSEVRDFLGHSSAAVTERYAHLAPGHLHALARATSGPGCP